MEKILVVYASKAGSTAEVAQKIAERLGNRGMSADVRSVEDVSDVSGYQAVVLGSAVRMGRWLPAAVKFVQDQAAALKRMPTAFFSVHLLATDDSQGSIEQRAKYVEPVHAVLTPGNEAFFAGKMDMGRLNLGERLLCKAMHAVNEDNRNWQSIDAWADSLKLA